MVGVNNHNIEENSPLQSRSWVSPSDGMVDVPDSKSGVRKDVSVRVRPWAMYRLLEKFKLVCFDFDGTLVDSEPLHFQAWNQTLEKRNLPTLDSFELYCTYAHSSQGLMSFFPVMTLELWQKIRKEKSDLYTLLIEKSPPAPLPGVDKLLDYLANNRIDTCVVTNSPLHDISLIRACYPLLHRIPCWITREDCVEPKPHPDGYLQALALHKLSPQEAVAIEDAPKGLEAALRAHIQPIILASHSLGFEDIPYFPSYPTGSLG